MTTHKKAMKVQKYIQDELPFDDVSDSVESYLIEEGKEEESIRELFN